MTAPLFLHGFGARYDLPGPLFLYLFAAAGVVVLSFVMVVLFAGDKLGEEAVSYPRRRDTWLEGAANAAWPRVAGAAIGVFGLVAVIVTGLFGSQNPFYNPAEYLVWVYFWSATVILAGLVGNLWALLNPWAALYALLRRPDPPDAGSGSGIWGAVATYFGFACLELTSGIANRPAVLAWLALAYTVFTLGGMLVFGGRRWLRSVECFTVLFDIVARFGPIETERNPDGKTRVYLRIWGTGLLKGERAGWDRVVFVILMLSTLAFDGILATPVHRWWLSTLGPLFDPLGPLAVPALRTVGLVVLTAVFLAAFVFVMRFVMWFGWPEVGSPFSRWKGVDEPTALSAFALTLVPIALVYNAAHNYTYVVVQSQGLIPLLADPLRKGWHLLPTAGYQISFLLAGAAVVWYVQIVLIVLGHVIAVYLAHLRAGQRFKNTAHVLLSQYPMLLLMVLYTMTSLWILAQPITKEV
ncbi:MAG: hypothetical protein M3Z98_04950 [Candidatus Dormibacteraeota bacterium]|nr:hypothetical protein [Candidatus Dormibacteraeota bacterium]